MVRFAIAVFALLLPFTALAEPYKVERIGERLRNPWGMDFLSADRLIVTERKGSAWIYDLKTGGRQPLSGLPDVVARGQGGLLDVLVSGDQEAVYFCFSRRVENGAATAIMRARLDGSTLTDQRIIFTSNAGSGGGYHFGCRLVLSDGLIHASIGDRGDRTNSQNPSIHAGVVVRLHPDGEAPAENPRLNGWAAEVLTTGHRNPQGMAIHPESGVIWVNEHGPKGGDEINILEPGANYGWPITSHGKEYSGATVGDGLKSAPGITDPIWVWVPSIAPSGMAFYKGDIFPEWQGHILVPSLKFRSLYVVRLEDGKPVSEEAVLKRRIGRIRDVAVAPDGAVLLLSDEHDGGLYRITR
ncbi:MAG: sugar dehydrogenase [SAR116 cluster bacterium MED-G04]|jgi:glucose/arabinose dehydrogenase|nr:sugar dehydrogenase [SAR116 cluster bacterium]OUW36260.1 MAG: hypothetical protein CBD43_05495 [Gammaproteobacteria bacterium TMED183]PDH66039.1 MAG: sugar dehydrogenase [SAR116 cluster bacterium MED-G04]HCD50736.1 sugar dehydrogenase [Alphaproteobacteria bacterium]CAI8349450.1 MAG: Aldose sugar dehydrogenase YliI [SAR116 cluster bacterium MED-G04]|tara:strand:+ start:2307 stop:3374 length:1068 start_codon:yes stop_codon:yes gene_type:complete